jgi:hypothetical protein
VQEGVRKYFGYPNIWVKIANWGVPELQGMSNVSVLPLLIPFVGLGLTGWECCLRDGGAGISAAQCCAALRRPVSGVACSTHLLCSACTCLPIADRCQGQGRTLQKQTDGGRCAVKGAAGRGAVNPPQNNTIGLRCLSNPPSEQPPVSSIYSLILQPLYLDSKLGALLLAVVRRPVAPRGGG